LFQNLDLSFSVDTAKPDVDVNALVDIVAKIEVIVGGAADKCKDANGTIDIDINVALKVVVDLIIVSPSLLHDFYTLTSP